MNTQDFRKALNEDANLQAKVTDAFNKEGIPGVIKIASEHGCIFSEKDLENSYRETELTDFELELVTGGKKIFNIGGRGW